MMLASLLLTFGVETGLLIGSAKLASAPGNASLIMSAALDFSMRLSAVLDPWDDRPSLSKDMDSASRASFRLAFFFFFSLAAEMALMTYQAPPNNAMMSSHPPMPTVYRPRQPPARSSGLWNDPVASIGSLEPLEFSTIDGFQLILGEYLGRIAGRDQTPLIKQPGFIADR